MAETLRREIGTPGAVLLGLGSILGTGVFVSLALAVDRTGRQVVWAVAIAALLALFNGLSSAQLAAAHPVAGGTYEYGYRVLHPVAGLVAGWLFLLAKSASAATAALGVGDYLGLPTWVSPVVVGLVGGLVLTGLRRSNRVNAVLVLFTIAMLVALVVWALGGSDVTDVRPEPDRSDLLGAAALVFVAFTGYGRVATLGEEIRDPERSIPIAVVATLAVAAVLYGVVAFVLARGPAVSADEAPLVTLAAGSPIGALVRVAALAAMVGVLVNLVLGLSRVALAMGRRVDLPASFATIDSSGRTPTVAVVAVTLFVAALSLVGDVGLTWSFSAATVLLYYTITNLAAMRLPPEKRRFPVAFSVLGLAGCLSLAAFVDRWVWIPAAAVIAAVTVFHLARRSGSAENGPSG